MSSMKKERNDAVALNIKGASLDRSAVQHIVSEICDLPSHGVLVTATTACGGCVLGLCLTQSLEESLSEAEVDPLCALEHFFDNFNTSPSVHNLQISHKRSTIA